VSVAPVQERATIGMANAQLLRPERMGLATLPLCSKGNPMSEKNSERLNELEAELRNAVHRLTALEEQMHRLARTVDQLRNDYAEEPRTLEEA
jgi:hypothetical protein